MANLGRIMPRDREIVSSSAALFEKLSGYGEALDGRGKNSVVSVVPANAGTQYAAAHR